MRKKNAIAADKMTAEERYQQFLEEAAMTETVYVQIGEITKKGNRGSYMNYGCVWPSEAAAKLFEPRLHGVIRMDVHAFCDYCIELEEEASMSFLVYPVYTGGCIVSAEELAQQLMQRLEQIERR